MSQLVSLREYARSRRARGLPGGTLGAVQKAILRKRITPIEGKIDPEVADIQWGRNTDVAQQQRGATGGHPPVTPAPTAGETTEPASPRNDYFDSRGRREEAEAQLAELELREKLGELGRVVDFRRALDDIGRLVKDRLQVIPDRTAAIVRAAPDDATAHALISKEIRSVLEALASVAAPTLN